MNLHPILLLHSTSRKDDKLGLLSLTKYNLSLVMGFLDVLHPVKHQIETEHKLVVLGCCLGKSALIIRFVTGNYPEETWDPTIGLSLSLSLSLSLFLPPAPSSRHPAG